MSKLTASKSETMKNIINLNNQLNELLIFKEKLLCPNCLLYSETEKRLLVFVSLHKCIEQGLLFSQFTIPSEVLIKIINKLESENLIVIVTSKELDEKYISLTIEGRCAVRVITNRVKISPTKYLSCLNEKQLAELDAAINLLLKSNQIQSN